MRSLSQLSRRYLRRQWKRTLFTTLGIIMATALFAGLALLFTSFVNMYVRAEEAASGRWHYHVSGLTMEQARQLQGNIRIKDSQKITSSPWLAELNRTNEDNWLLLRDISEMENDLTPYPMTLLNGRLPQNESEIALNVSSLAYYPNLELNQEIELILHDKRPESTAETVIRTYTVTGILDWVDTNLPGPVYYALTHLHETDKDLAEVYLTVKGSTEYEATLSAALQDVLPDLFDPTGVVDTETRMMQIKYSPFEGAAIWSDLTTVRFRTHDQLLRFLGQSSYGDTNQDLLQFFGLLAAIIMVSVVFVIRNSFAMSVSERAGEYGLLRVVGGSPSQIRRLVLQDAMQMALIGIPAGLLAGLAAMRITLGYVSGLGIPEIEYLKLVVSPWPLALAAGLSLLAILLAALSPALQASRLAPVDAIRRSGVYTVKGKSDQGLASKGLISRRLLGITGFLAGRSIRRDRRRFRITTLSIVVSAILFLAAGGISLTFSRQLVRFNSEQTDFRLNAYTTGLTTGDARLGQIYNTLSGQEDVNQLAMYGQFYQPIQITPELVSEKMIELIQKSYQVAGQPASREQVLEHLAAQDLHARIILADRAFLDQLDLSDTDRVWQELQQGRVLLAQTIPVSVSELSFQTVPYTALSVGDALPMRNHTYYDEESEQMLEQPGLPMHYEIAAEIETLPWFTEGFFSGGSSVMLIMDRAYMQQKFTAFPALQQSVGVEEILAVDAAEGSEKDVLQVLAPHASENSFGVRDSLTLQNNFAQLQTSRGLVKTINVFVYGFTTVIVLICCMNILNTVTTNVLLRRRELAMLQAVGMSRAQVRQMLLMECSLYGIYGAIWGSAIGTLLLYLLGISIEGTMGNMVIRAMPWNLIAATLAGALILSVLAGILPIRRVMKDDVVEAIRQL